MKKPILLICLLFAGVVTVKAQGFSMGIRGGLNFSKETAKGGGGSISLDTRTSFLLGAYTKFMFTSKIGLQPELFYSAMGGKSGSDTEKINYLSIPVFFRYNVTDNFHLLAGPQYSILVSAKDIVSGQPDEDIKDQLNSLDFGGVLGVGVDFGPFNAGARYNFGLTNISKDATSGYTLKNSAIQIVAGFKLFGK